MPDAGTTSGSAPPAALAARLEEIIAPLGSVAVAFSGGVDSAVVLRAAVASLGARALAVTARSASFAPEEMEIAERTAREAGAAHRWVDTEEITLRGYRENPLERCFFCKTELYRKMRALADAEGIAAIADGANADDALGHDRPGLLAAERAGVVSPLLLLGMRKPEVRAVARHYGLSVAEKPAMACLSSRIPFGETITPEKLAQVGAAESALRRLGFEGARVRHHGAVARIELPPERIAEALAPARREALVAGVKAAGFTYAALDLEGYRAGSMHEVLQIRPLSRRAAGLAQAGPG